MHAFYKISSMTIASIMLASCSFFAPTPAPEPPPPAPIAPPPSDLPPPNYNLAPYHHNKIIHHRKVHVNPAKPSPTALPPNTHSSAKPVPPALPEKGDK